MIRKIFVIVLTLIVIIFSNFLYFEHNTASNIYGIESVPTADAVIILGAYVFPDGQASLMLQDRLNCGFLVYSHNKAPKVIVSGDHGKTSYDEVNSMRKILELKGINRSNIFMDHAGFDTYDSMYRARDIFQVKKAIIVTQKFHLVRALYIAKQLGLEAYGVPSDTMEYPLMDYYYAREMGARLKAFCFVNIFKPTPKFLGDAIPIWKEGELTDDGKS